MAKISDEGRRALEHGITTCRIRSDGADCYEPAHVVLFATVDGPVGGQAYSQGDRVYACLRHGGQLYDAMHTHPDKWPRWLSDDPWITLPAPRLASHTPTPRPGAAVKPWTAKTSGYARAPR